jgi:hypothetical protein
MYKSKKKRSRIQRRIEIIILELQKYGNKSYQEIWFINSQYLSVHHSIKNLNPIIFKNYLFKKIYFYHNNTFYWEC